MDYKWPCIALCCYLLTTAGSSLCNNYLDTQKEIAKSCQPVDKVSVK